MNMMEIAVTKRHHLGALKARERWKPAEIVFWLALVAVYFVFPTSLVFASQILITGLFALSLDLILGYAGIVSLGHAAFFGLGAYSAGLLAVNGYGDPILGLAVGALVATVAGFLVSFLVVRGTDLTRLMVTLGVGMMLFEVANKVEFTGGVDGLSGMEVGKIFGLFEFDLYGKTAYVYSFVVLFVLFVVLRRLVNSPFGLGLVGIREGKRRMPAIGANIEQRLKLVFTVGAGVAGIAGALLAQTTQFVGLDTLGFVRSADLLIVPLMPCRRSPLPASAHEIESRSVELAFTTPFLAELRTLAAWRRELPRWWPARWQRPPRLARLHLVEGAAVLAALAPESRLVPSQAFLRLLRDHGRRRAYQWLEGDGGHVGRRSTFDPARFTG